MKVNLAWLLLVPLIVFGCKPKTKTKTVIVDRIVEKPVDPPVETPVEPPVEPPIDPPVRFIDFDEFESETFRFASRLNDNDAANARFVSVCEQQNQGKPIGNYIKAIDKAINSISQERDIVNTVAVGGLECLRALDLDDYGLNAVDWDNIVAANPFLNTFESFTRVGDQIKTLVNEDQYWMPGHIFIFTVFDAPVYYDLLDLPDNLLALQLQLGLDLQANFDDEDTDTYLFGHTGSSIALGKNRMHLRTEIDDGHYYQSYDVLVANVGLADKNIFQSPFPIEARSAFTLVPDGHEVIFSLPNKMHGYYLADGNGLRQDFAPLDLVVDTRAASQSLDPTIRPLACAGCHINGLIERQDEIFNKVKDDNTFDIVDIQKSEFWHGRPNQLAQQLRSDNQSYQNSLRGVGTSPQEGDFINFYTDKIRKESDIRQVAALMFLQPDEFEDRLLRTIASKNEIGSIVEGKTIAFEQLQETLGKFVVEANIFRDDFGE